jgi:stearoyl-CoA 9-desaturase NADPH oxidoreductase
VVETGATPKVSGLRRQTLRALRAMTTPLLPDDYLALINPRWSTRELTGAVIRVRPETEDARTIVVKPHFDLPRHQPGQYLRIGMEVNGVRRWRAYSITSDPDHPEGVISITVKHASGGKMSPLFAREVRAGQPVFLGDIEGEFLLPDPVPDKLLFVSAGSGITPIWSMLRELERRNQINDTVHVHSSRTSDDFIFGKMLRRMTQRQDGYRLCEIYTADQPRFSADALDEICPDWRERELFVSGPRDLIDDLEKRAANEGRADHFHSERFQPVIGNGGGEGAGGSVHFRVSDCETECAPGESILVGGENAGATLQFGCRMGICHTCVGRLKDGAVRDLRTGAIEQASGQMIRVCINAPEGHVEIDL